MLTAEEKIQHFSRQVFSKAQSECNEMLLHAKQEAKAQTERYENHCLENPYAQIQKQMAQIQRSAGESVSRAQLESKKELLEKRENIMTCVFDEVSEKLTVFHQSEDYEAFLEDTVRSAAELLGTGSKSVFLDSSDAKYLPALAEKFPDMDFSVLDAKESVVGGARVLNRDTNQLADVTIAARLEAEKQRFLESSGLIL